jgi:drug/metabolite transporter (DMT)-like permease
MNANRRHAVAGLIAAGLLWGTTVPLSKLALQWLSPGWLTTIRFGLAAAVLLAAARRRGLRRAFTPAVLAAGALGYGGSVLLQNAGISQTSVTHAALLIGAVPVLVAIIAAVWHRIVARRAAWFGFVVSLGGVGLITTSGGGGGATLAGDGLVLASLVLSAAVTVAQGRLLTGRDPVAVTAVQFLGAALGALPVAAVTGGVPAAPGGAGPVLAVAALAVGGTLLPFTLFAFGQSRVSAEVAGAFLNLEPLVGAIAGGVAFGDPIGFAQAAGGVAIVAGIGLSSLPLLTSRQIAPYRQPVTTKPLAAAASNPPAAAASETLAPRVRRLPAQAAAIADRRSPLGPRYCGDELGDRHRVSAEDRQWRCGRGPFRWKTVALPAPRGWPARDPFAARRRRPCRSWLRGQDGHADKVPPPIWPGAPGRRAGRKVRRGQRAGEGRGGPKPGPADHGLRCRGGQKPLGRDLAAARNQTAAA